MWLRHRQRAQMTVLMLYAALILTGAVSLVVDAGVFFVTQRQMQTAVDAAALAAVWYDPVCTYLGTPPPPEPVDCQTSKPALPDEPTGWPPCGPDAECVAYAVLQENLGFTGALCRNLQPSPGRPDIIPAVIGGTTYSMTSYIIVLDCDAPYWFARVFPNIPATMHLRTFARATIGYSTPTGVSPIDTTGSHHIVSRLLP